MRLNCHYHDVLNTLTIIVKAFASLLVIIHTKRMYLICVWVCVYERFIVNDRILNRPVLQAHLNALHCLSVSFARRWRRFLSTFFIILHRLWCDLCTFIHLRLAKLSAQSNWVRSFTHQQSCITPAINV